MHQGSFPEVFGSIVPDADIIKAFSGTYVNLVWVDEDNGSLNVDVTLCESIESDMFAALEAELLCAFPSVTAVNFMLKEGAKAKQQAVIPDEVWNELLCAIKNKSAACHALLSACIPEVAQEKLILKFRSKGSFVFSSFKADVLTESFLAEKLGFPLKVVLADNAAAPPAKKERRADSFETADELPPWETVKASEPKSQEPRPAAAKEKPSFAYNNAVGKPVKRHKQVKVMKRLEGIVTRLYEELAAEEKILIEGVIFNYDERMTKSGKKLVIFDVTDNTNSVTVKLFVKPEKFTKDFIDLLKIGKEVKVYGRVTYDEFSKELILMAEELAEGRLERNGKTDTAEKKRVELHLHTKMSQTDAVASVGDYIKKAKEYGHTAIAVTDHGVLQAYPEAMSEAKKQDIKVIYGVEAYLVDDVNRIVKAPKEYTLDDEFVVFDIETTGLKKESCEIIEIGAVKLRNGEITGSFGMFVNPERPLPEEITELTGITDDDLKDAEGIEAVMPKFLEFVGSAVLAAHNAEFDVPFISFHAEKLGMSVNNSRFCTLELSRALFPELGRHRLDAVCKHIGVALAHHHRAEDDAKACSGIFSHARRYFLEQGITTLKQVNEFAEKCEDKKKLHSSHAIILVKNLTGLRNLYELVSDAHIKHYYHSPKIPKSEFTRLREGLILGGACEAGEIFKAVHNRESESFLNELADYYDYLEIQPVANNMFMLDNGSAGSVEDLRDINRRIVELGDRCGKPTVAACDCHFVNEEDEIYRKILTAPKADKKKEEGIEQTAPRSLPLYLRTTDEMLAEFSYLGKESAYKVVVENTNAVADLIEKILPIPNGTFPPHIEGSDARLTEISYSRAKELYGDPLPAPVKARLERELGSIIKNGFAVMYVIAEILVKKSVEDGYLVGSRGSVGSSFVATMASITEVNPFPPHYYCESCKFTDFESEQVQSFIGGSGCDMPDRECPNCGAMLKKDGHDIPFETFLGFDGDKEPDIDLNFSGEYQAKAHAFTEELFGTGYVFKAGTIGTLASKTAYGYVKKFCDDNGMNLRKAEENRLTLGLTGVKKTTGQHPGGLVVVPNGRSIYEFTPVQRPANDTASDVVTTHFDYHSISGRLLKLDILGHDVPTIIRMLHDFTGVDPTKIDIGRKDVMSLFTSPKALGVTEAQIGCPTGSLGLPEFGTPFVRQMLMDTKPATFSELVRISGLSHGTNVWIGNAYDLIKNGTATLKDIIPTRDDIMVYLVNKGVEKLRSFKIMESVRKGKGVSDEEAELMRAANVPEWYIDSCKKISYMFPKGHAVAYVMMTVRIGYYKIHHPLAFYAAMFSVKLSDFDYGVMCRGKAGARAEYKRLSALGGEMSAKDESAMSLLELILEMYERGYEFADIDLYTSDTLKFKISNGKVLPPFCAVPGLGENAANTIIEAKKDGEFISIEDLRSRTKLTKTVTAAMKEHGILDGLGDTNQISFI